jgi:putative ABC transport system permease protein
LIRDYRSKEIRLLVAAVLCSIICLTAIAFSIDSIKRLLSDTSASLQGGDRVITSPVPISTELNNFIKNNSSASTETLSFYSMISDAKATMLASVKAVSKPYPLYGKLLISDALDGTPVSTSQVPEPGTIWLETRILLELNLVVGASVEVGDLKLRVAAVLVDEPDRITDGFGFIPRALINMQDVAATNAVQAGSRVTYKLLINSSGEQLRNFDNSIVKFLSVDYKLKTIAENTNEFRNLNLAENYLGLAILVNMAIAAIAIGIAARHYSKENTINAAILRCLGASSKHLTLIFTVSLVLGSLILGLVGSGVGFGMQQLIAFLISKHINLQLPAPSYYPIWYGIFGAMLLVLIGALPSLIRLSKVSPMQALRRETNAGVVKNWHLKFNFSLRMPAILRLSLNNIIYNAQHNLLQVLAFAFIVCVALVLFNVRSDLLNTWFAQMPQDTPNYFALNISPKDRQPLQEYLKNEDIKATEFYPVVRGTLIKINNEAVTTGEDLNSNRRNGIHRPLNLTWTDNLPLKNEILQGAWFTQNDTGKNVLSIENELANRLGVSIDDELTFVVNLQEIKAKITSIRSVQWGSFTPNFYVIYPPGVIDNAASTFLVSFLLPADKAHLIRNIVTDFPGINIISIAEMIRQANMVIKLLSTVIWFIWFFTLAIGLILMLAVVLSGIGFRNNQNNLMRILGASRFQLQSILSLEYLILGAIAGLLGSSVAIAVTMYVSHYFFANTYAINWYTISGGCMVGGLMMWCGGFLGTYKALRTAPMQFTRS